MPWKTNSKEEQRFDLVRQMMAGLVSVITLCRRFGISRQTAYKWRQRYRLGKLRGLKEQSRRPLVSPGQTGALWLRRVRRFRESHPTWGARKLSYELCRRYEPLGAPAVATISRWLKRWGLSRRYRRWLRGPGGLRQALRVARHCREGGG